MEKGRLAAAVWQQERMPAIIRHLTSNNHNDHVAYTFPAGLYGNTG
nr:hypothetical protein [uncultured Chitinophaga sp.]